MLIQRDCIQGIYIFKLADDTQQANIGIYINRSKKVLHIQFGGQYLPQYSIFNHMSCIIMEAWLLCFSFMLK